MTTANCPRCNTPIRRKRYSNYGWALLAAILLLDILFLFLFQVIPGIMELIGIGFALYFILKKDKYFYYCKKCVLKFSADQVQVI
jgi:uncharacterized paraquat-inducible protein A